MVPCRANWAAMRRYPYVASASSKIRLMISASLFLRSAVTLSGRDRHS
jgi:hypothetical protein